MKNKKVLIAFLLALILNLYYNLNIPRLNTDNLFQTTTAINFLNGNGISLSSPNFDDLSHPNYKYDMRWPAGYLLLVIPLLLVTKNILIINAITVGIGFIILFLGLKKVIDALKLSHETQLLFWVLISFAYTPFRLLGTTDLFAAALILFAAGLTINLLSKQKINPRSRAYLFKIGFVSLLAVSASLFRYAYFPISFFIVITLIVQTIKDKRHLWPLLISIVLVGAGIYGIQSFSTYFELASVKARSDVSFQFSGLLNIHNIFTSLFIPEHVFRQILIFLNISLERIFWIQFTVNVILFIGFVWLLFLFIKRILKQKNSLLQIATVMLITIGLLTIMPLVYSYLKSGFVGYENTYRAYRYYALASVSLLLFVFLFYDYLASKHKTEWRWLIIGLLIIPVFLYFGYIQTQFKPFNPKANLAHFYAPEGATYDYFDLYKYIRPYNDTKTIFVVSKGSKVGHVPGGDQFLYLLVQIEGAQWMPTEDFLEKELKTSQPVDIIFAQSTEIDKPELNKKIQKHNAKKIASLDKARFNLFHFTLKPNIDAPQ